MFLKQLLYYQFEIEMIKMFNKEHKEKNNETKYYYLKTILNRMMYFKY